MIYIRADMNNIIATGHIMRCLTIADAAKALGVDTVFILADEQAVQMIQQCGYKTIVLHTKWNDVESELDILQRIIAEENIECLLIDSYMVTEEYLSALSSQTKVAYIDDLNAFHYPVDILICYANYWRKFGYEERYDNTKLLLGSQYTPLRKVFCDCSSKTISSNTENLLLMSGGTDNFHILEGLLQVIEKNKYRNIDVICGRYNTDYEKLCRQYEEYRNIHFHKAVNNIESYMKKADIAISAGGTTLYELCACGTPTISYSFADNQLDNVEQFQKDELIDYAGDVRKTNIFENVKKLLNHYTQNYDLRKGRSRKMQQLIDGNGASRIVGELIKI